MPRLALLFIILSSIVLSGCSTARSVVSNSGEAEASAQLQVIQTGKTPINWTQFSPSTPPGFQYWGIVEGPDDNMWLTELNDGKLIRVSMTGAIKIFSLGSIFAPKYLTVGSDGNLWVASATSPAKIGRVTTAGVLTTFAVPSGEEPIGGIAEGPDGNVWFATTDRIGRIKPSGQVKEFAYPTSGGGAGGVTAGPDGDVWFTEPNHNKISNIDPATLAIKEFDLGASGLTCNSRSIVTGSDGNLWIVCGANIARVTTAGVATAFPNPFGFVGSWQDLAPGPDGRIWMSTGRASGAIAAIDPITHVVTSFTSPFAGDFSNAIVAGPDQNIWVSTQAQGHVDAFILHVMTVTPKSTTFTAAGQAQIVTVSEPHTTSWTARSNKPAVATVTAGTSANKFVVKSVGLGTTTVIIADSIGNSFIVKVTVT